MNEGSDELRKAARQLIDTELLLGGEDIPAERNPLPAPEGGRSLSPGGVSTEDKQRLLEQMDADEVRPCTKCRLCESRRQTVFGEGGAGAELVFVGEGPGEEEDRQGRPFVGRAGKKLDEMIAAMGLRRQDVYICNVVKCRPPGNRAPLPDEAHACCGYLIRQLEIIRPKVICTLGNPATQALLNTKVGITKLRGAWQQLGMIGEGLANTAVMPTFHPAFLLRQYTQENRRKVWEDLQKVMEALDVK